MYDGMKNSPVIRYLLVWVILFGIPSLTFALDAKAKYPAVCVTTANLNVRMSDNTNGRVVTTLPKGTSVKVKGLTVNGWAVLEDKYMTVYCSASYLKYVKALEEPVRPKSSRLSESGSSDVSSKIAGWDIWVWLLYIGVSLIVLYIIQRVLLFFFVILSTLFYRLYLIISFPFYVLNALQRYLAKPWRPFYKKNKGDDLENFKKREIYERIKIPFYILLTPLRFVNAAYYNLLVHCSFELFNYVIEVVFPANKMEGGGNFVFGVIMIPWRIVKYLLWHGSFTLIESCVWTVIDTFVPALTLYHGTDGDAAESITMGPGRTYSRTGLTGIWNVGGGNFAGNGIYFAPLRDTAYHYACGSVIVCRVSLGRTLDLGLAPKYVYDQCGHPNALGATKWGLENGYVTGEWWREGCNWWEYCMYDWQNRYNHSWRIRPLYVLDIEAECFQRIPGGMAHWLFRWMVVKDLYRHIFKNFY